jgi:hypothetical protein
VKRIAILALLGVCLPAFANTDEPFEWHVQATYARQFKPAFASGYEGANSLRAARATSYTFTGTVFLAAHPAAGTELYFNPEFVQGNPFSELHGLGGFTNGELQRGAGATLKAYRARLFLRQTWNLSGEFEEQPSEQNQVRTKYAAERLVLTAGNLSATDVFDAMDYSHDARMQFMNWASLTYGAWDYPADARGYTWGAALEYVTSAWQVRAGRFLVPKEADGLQLSRNITKYYGDVVEFEAPYRLAGRPAIVRALAFHNRVFDGSFRDALAFGAASGLVPDVQAVRNAQSKAGFGVGTQVEVTKDVGAYLRAGWNDGRTQAYMFTEIDRSLATGAVVKGTQWGRPDDTMGIAGYVNGLSRAHRDYLGAGGLTFFLGDGRLNYGTERIFETYYNVALGRRFWFALDYQRIANPGYNRDRGPADFFGFRMHTEL